MKHHLQVFRAAVRVTILDYLTQPLWLFWMTITPFVFALVGVFLYQDASPKDFALYVVLGSGVMGMWASTLGGAGYSVHWERLVWGTFPYTLTTPASQLWIAAGKSVVYAVTGLLVLVEIVIVTALFFGVHLTIASPLAFSLAVLLTFFSFSVIGLLLSSLFVLTRAAGYWQNALSRFLYVFCGVLYPISVLPGWMLPVSYVLAPTWGLGATRLSVEPGALYDVLYLTDIGLALLLMIAYILLAWYVQKMVERRVRVVAELERM